MKKIVRILSIAMLTLGAWACQPQEEVKPIVTQENLGQSGRTEGTFFIHWDQLFTQNKGYQAYTLNIAQSRAYNTTTVNFFSYTNKNCNLAAYVRVMQSNGSYRDITGNVSVTTGQTKSVSFNKSVLKSTDLQVEVRIYSTLSPSTFKLRAISQ